MCVCVREKERGSGTLAENTLLLFGYSSIVSLQTENPLSISLLLKFTANHSYIKNYGRVHNESVTHDTTGLGVFITKTYYRVSLTRSPLIITAPRTIKRR